MDKELVKRLVLESGMQRESWQEEGIERFAALVAEECAKRCDEQAAVYETHISTREGERQERAEHYKEAVEWVAAAIRAKFKAEA